MGWLALVVISGCSSTEVIQHAGGEGGGGSGGQGGAMVTEPPPTGALRWAASFGGADYQVARALAARGDGSTVLAGGFRGQVDFGNGLLVSDGEYYDALVLGLETTGAPLFSIGAGQKPGHEDMTEDVAIDAQDNAVIVGSFYQSASFGGAPLSAEGFASFVVKLDRSGKALWSRTFTGIDGAFHVAVDEGAVVLTGAFSTSVSFGGEPLLGDGDGEADVFVAKLDAEGNHVWSRSIGGLGSQVARGVAIGMDGDIAIAGAFNDELDIAGITYTTSQPFFDWDAFVARLDPNGEPEWSRVFSDGGDAGATAVAVGSSGEVAVGGIYEGELEVGAPHPLPRHSVTNFFVVALEPAGDLRFAVSSGGGQGSVEYEEGGLSLAIDPWDNVIAAGGFNESLDFGGGPIESAGFDDVFVVKLDARGTPSWQRSFGAVDSQFATDVAVDASGRIYAAGSFHNRIELESAPPLVSGGDLDIFVLSLEP